MVLLGVILLILGLLLAGWHILVVVGIVLIVVGLLANFFYGYRRPVGSRRYWY